jgi:membrane protease YdiL (CAAX protease family)
MKTGFFHSILVVAWAAALAFLISLLGQGIWTALVTINLATDPQFPWAVLVMAALLWLIWLYLNGRGWPRSTSETRRRYLRARPVPKQVFAWAILAGGLSIGAVAGLWIVMARIARMPGSVLPDLSRYPLLTAVLAVGMGSLISPLLEQAGFWGYGQSILEQGFRGPVAVLISSLLYVLLPHPPAGDALWARLAFYFLTGLTFGAMAYLTQSILPGLLVHILGILVFFTLVWPADPTRQLIGQGGTDIWFWLQIAQVIIFSGLAILAFRRLDRAAKQAASTPLPILQA